MIRVIVYSACIIALWSQIDLSDAARIVPFQMGGEMFNHLADVIARITDGIR